MHHQCIALLAANSLHTYIQYVLIESTHYVVICYNFNTILAGLECFCFGLVCATVTDVIFVGPVYYVVQCCKGYFM